MSSHHAHVPRLIELLHQVRALQGQAPLAIDANSRFVDVVDSMGFVEFLATVAEDCGVPIETIERAAGRRYGSIGELASLLAFAIPGFTSECPTKDVQPSGLSLHKQSVGKGEIKLSRGWVAAAAARLPSTRQQASAINAVLHRPRGWLEKHAGIEARYLWEDDDPLSAAADAALDCLRTAGLSKVTVGALLVTSECPPLLTGLAAALHARLGLSSPCATLEIGGACTGFLKALWIARHLFSDLSAVLVIAVEAPSRWLSLSPTPAGEAAALFGDGAAACLLTVQPVCPDSLSMQDILLGTDGSAGSLLQVEMTRRQGAELHMSGIALAHRAVRTMADAVRQLCSRQNLSVEQLSAVIAHGGNGRMSALLARCLNLPPERVRSETAHTGNLGSASLPVAWTACDPSIPRPVVWTAVGAGLQWGAALFDAQP